MIAADNSIDAGVASTTVVTTSFEALTIATRALRWTPWRVENNAVRLGDLAADLARCLRAGDGRDDREPLSAAEGPVSTSRPAAPRVRPPVRRSRRRRRRTPRMSALHTPFTDVARGQRWTGPSNRQPE
jgi:hypothetical protein